MRAHCQQHVPFEGLGSIEAWLRGSGDAITATRVFEHAPLHDPRGIDLLVVMGGPIGGKDNGAPGLRPHHHPDHYAAFVIDPDGHDVEAVYHRPEA